MARIALVCSVYHPRTCGVGDYTMRVGGELLKRGHLAKVFTSAPAEPHPLVPELEVVAIAGPAPRVCLGLGREISSFRPDVVLLQHIPFLFGAPRFGFPTSAALALQVRRSGVRLVVLAHELYLPWSTATRRLPAAAHDRLQVLALRELADAFVVTTDDRLTAMQQWPIHRDRLLLIPVGANATPVPAVPAERTDRFDIGVFSTLAYPDQARLALDTFTEVARLVPDARLILIGDVSRRRDSPLADVLPRHPFRDRIVLTGKLDLPTAAARVASLDVFLCPADTGANTRSSTLPVALGSGVPVVAARGVETGRWFVDGDNVLFAHRWDAPAMAAAIVRLWKEPALRHHLARGGRTLFDRHMRWSRIVDQLPLVPNATERSVQTAAKVPFWRRLEGPYHQEGAA